MLWLISLTVIWDGDIYTSGLPCDRSGARQRCWRPLISIFIVCLTSTWPVNTLIGGFCRDVGLVDAREEDEELDNALLLGLTDDGGIAGGGGGSNVALEIEVVLSEQDGPLRTGLEA